MLHKARPCSWRCGAARISTLGIILLACCALHVIMLFLAIVGDNLGWTVYWLFALCLDIYSLGESWN